MVISFLSREGRFDVVDHHELVEILDVGVAFNFVEVSQSPMSGEEARYHMKGP